METLLQKIYGKKLGLTSAPIDLWEIIWYKEYIDDYDFVITKSAWWTEVEYESIEEVKEKFKGKLSEEWDRSLQESFDRLCKKLSEDLN